jgi:multidrug efflux pump
VDVDRLKAKVQGVSLTDPFQSLQVYLGSHCVNDFNIFGRVYRVMAQADSANRQTAADIGNLRTRSETGDMVLLGRLMTLASTYGSDPVVRYSGHPAADVCSLQFSSRA